MKPLLTRIRLAFLLIAFLCAAAYGQVQLGDITLGRSRPTIHLRPDVRFRPGEVGAAVRSIRWVGGIGGVAFGAIAKPRDVLVQSLSLSYIRSDSDGQRVAARINGHDYILPVPDWILAPAIAIAATDDIGLATAFGEYEGIAATSEERCDRYIFSVHAALQGSLLGLRVIQADLIGILPEQYADLPRIHGDYKLGVLESAPTPDELLQRRANQQNIFERVANYQSYVLTDGDVSFTVRDDTIAFVGKPTYQLWRSKLDGKIMELWVAEYAAGLREKSRDWMLARANALVNQMVASFRDTERRAVDPKLRSDLRANAEALSAAKSAIRQSSDDELPLVVAQLEWMSQAKDVELLADQENPLHDPDTIAASNPTIYADMTTLSQTLAFFRYVRGSFPTAWRRFRQDTRSVQSIKVELPTEVPRGEAARKACLAGRGGD